MYMRVMDSKLGIFHIRRDVPTAQGYDQSACGGVMRRVASPALMLETQPPKEKDMVLCKGCQRVASSHLSETEMETLRESGYMT